MRAPAIDVDVFISGGGPAGLIAAAALATAEASVFLADPAPPRDDDRDQRSTAVLRPGRALLESCGLWDALDTTPLEALRIVDLAGSPPRVRTERRFEGEGEGALGWNIMNAALRRAVLAQLRDRPGVELAFGTGFASLVSRTGEALVTLADGRRVTARLAVAADGRASALRDAAGIGVATTRYGQKALAFAVTHPLPHRGVSSEFYLDGGPFTMVPLPDRDGMPASAVVWMSDGPVATALAALPPEEFDEAIMRRTAGDLGPLHLAGPRDLWPVVTQRALRLTAERVVVIAEAAHVLPPIGAQGLNTSLADIAALARRFGADPAGFGSAPMLAAYEAERAPDLRLRAAAIDLYNRVTRSSDPLSQALRQGGLALIHDVAALRRAVVKAGMGPG